MPISFTLSGVKSDFGWTGRYRCSLSRDLACIRSQGSLLTVPTLWICSDPHRQTATRSWTSHALRTRRTSKTSSSSLELWRKSTSFPLNCSISKREVARFVSLLLGYTRRSKDGSGQRNGSIEWRGGKNGVLLRWNWYVCFTFTRVFWGARELIIV